MQEKLFNMLVNESDISWKAIIYDLIRTNQMDPWDVNVTLLAQAYIDRLNQLKQMDLKVSGKVLLAAAMLLKIKSVRLLGDDLLEFDRLIAGPSEEDSFYEDLEADSVRPAANAEQEDFPLYPRTPQPRKRKVSVFDLLNALEKALEVKHRRVNRLADVEMSAPEKKIDIGIVLANLFTRIKSFLGLRPRVTFEELMETKTPQEKVQLFIPLLYLSNERKISLRQETAFGDIEINLMEGSNVNAD